MKKVLFISHDATRTGAPMVLLHFLKWMQLHQPQVQLDLLVLKGGNLENEFKKVVQNYFNLEVLTKPQQLTRKQRVLLKLGWFKKPNLKEKLFLDLNQNNYDIVYANTILSIAFAYELVSQNRDVKFIAHLHELNAIIKMMLPNFDKYTNAIDHFICPSVIVKQNLIVNWAVSEDKIDIVYECAKIEQTPKQNRTTDLFTIGASGTVHWRKGQDVFIQVARYLCQHHPKVNFKFIWVGKISQHEQVVIEEDLTKLGLSDRVFFVGEVKNPEDYYQDFNVFLMPSREDPFPLVCIEAGMMGKPMISFEQAVGTNEILAQGGGFIVPYLSIEAMADKAMEYYNNPDLMVKHGTFNKAAFSQFTPDIICPQLFSIIQKAAAN